MLVVSCVFSKYGSQRCKFVLIKLFLEGVGGSTCSRVTCNRWCNSRSVIFCSGDKLLCSDNDSGSLVQSSSVLCGSFFYRRHVFCFEIHWQLTKAHGKGCLEMIRHPWCDGYLSGGCLEMIGHPWCDGYLSFRVGLNWWSSTWVVNDSTVRRTWKWSFMNGLKCRRLVSEGWDLCICVLWDCVKKMTEFLKSNNPTHDNPALLIVWHLRNVVSGLTVLLCITWCTCWFCELILCYLDLLSPLSDYNGFKKPKDG